MVLLLKPPYSRKNTKTRAHKAKIVSQADPSAHAEKKTKEETKNPKGSHLNNSRGGG